MKQKAFPVPGTAEELLERAQSLAGWSFQQLAQSLDTAVPENFTHAKGLLGQWLECYLGASAGTRSQPDFPHLGIELKSLPLNAKWHPSETTYICTVPTLEETLQLQFTQSRLYQKLQHVLWIPFEADPHILLPQRRIGSAFLWQPNPQEFMALQQDFEEIMEFISLQGLAAITADIGTYLQVRPKAANSRVKRRAFDAEGHLNTANPRGFYLRTGFTAKILKNIFLG